MAKQNGGRPAAGAVDLGEVARVGQRSFATIAHLHGRMIRDSLRFQAELLDFARRRVGADIEAQDRLMRCSSPNDAAQVMNDFYQCAARDYSEEAAGLMKLCVGMAAEAAEETVAEANQKARPES
ncbi:hypothetical protein M1105_06500 [Limibaculum sp. FT325]|uniref:phasin family protein n=1 Tax=Thermohalobaculum sediminis TaxID=2939436 RepID=UPI0020C0BA90|nr:phasin family protein [Limibaculum sediminis]MCL5776637.1 hypothetical protein [Limibaculum sediminis]